MMAQQDIAVLMVLVIGGVGLVLLIAGIGLIAWQKNKIKRCQEKTYGVVVGYRRRSLQLLVPIVEYHVFGKTYRKIRCFRGVIYKSWRRQSEAPIEITENDYVFLRGRMMSEKMAQKMWPLNMQMSVYYDPLKPQRAFVEKIPVKKPVISLIFVSLALCFIVLSGYLFYMVR